MAENQPTASPSPSPPAETSGEPPERPVFVHVMILLAAAMFVGMVALLYNQWVTRSPPNAIVIVEGTAAYDGARVWIENGQGQPAANERQLAQAENFSCRFLVPAGRGPYKLKVRLPDGAAEETAVDIKQYQMISLGLRNIAIVVQGNQAYEKATVWLEGPSNQRLTPPQALLAAGKYSARFMVRPDLTDTRVRVVMPGGGAETYPVPEFKDSKRIAVLLTRRSASAPAGSP